MQVQAVSLICSANRASIEAHMMHAVVIRSRATATAAVSKDSSSFFTDHMLVCHALVEVLVDHRQSRKPSLFGQTAQPALYHIEFVTRTRYSVKANTHLYAGTER